MKKLMICALCALAMVVSGCSLFVSDVSNVEIQFGWAEEGSATAINGYTCVGNLMRYVEAFQETFEPVASYKSWTTAGGSLYTEPMESKKAANFVKTYADKAIKLSESKCKEGGYDLPSGETFRVVYSYGAKNNVTKVLNYEVK